MKQKVLLGILLIIGLAFAVFGIYLSGKNVIQVLNPYSNPVLGGFWEIHFQTKGSEDLTIVANENTLMPQEVELEGVYCGGVKFNATTSENEIFVDDWECDGEGLLRLLVNDAGSHQMEFNFNGQKAIAHNFACNSGTLSDTCIVSSSQAMTNGETISGTGNLTITSTGSLTTAVGESFTINLSGGSSTVMIAIGGSITGNVTINAVDVSILGSINAAGKGVAGHNTISTDGGGSGGGYRNTNGDAGGGGFAGGGGNGRTNSGSTTRGLGGITYGSVIDPVDFGSAGGTGSTTANTSGAGGGLVKITATGTTTISGSVMANGGNATGTNGAGAGGGSGGSINISTGTLTGAGSITSDGGNGSVTSNTYEGGGGGGGRIALFYDTKSVFIATVTAYGGQGGNTTTDAIGSQFGAAGTIYDKDNGATYGDLTVDNNHLESGSIRYFGTVGVANTTQASNSYTFGDVAIKNGATYIVESGLGFGMTGSLSSGTYLATLKIPGNFTGPSSLTIPSGLDFVQVDGGGFSSVNSLTIASGGYFTLDSYTAGDSAFSSIPTITVNGALQHSISTGTTEDHVLKLSATTITVGSGGSIDVTGKGFLGASTLNTDGQPAGAGGGYKNTNGDAGGGAYGGDGGAGKTNSGTVTRGLGGTAFGTALNPTHIGSAGGTANTANTAGSGGGAILLTVSGTLTVTGSIKADGGGATDNGTSGAGGGSGGAININAGTLAGAGSITSNGGAGTLKTVYEGGGGGGGRMQLSACTFTQSGSRTVTGGNGGNNGSDGSIIITPSCATTAYSNNSDASAGTTNPTNLTSTTPAFSALCNDPQAGDIINKAQIQVSTDSSFASVTHWDSGSSGNTITDCTAGDRIANITYGSFGTAPTLTLATSDGAITYYWRIKFWDDDGAEGPWSTDTNTFTMSDGGGISIDVVDASNVSLGSPSVNLTSAVYSNTSPQTVTGTTPSGTNKIRVTNSSGSPSWTVTIGATAGSSTLWSDGGSATFDFNDPSGAGQLTINPSASTLTPVNPATSTGITKGNSTAFSNNNSVTVLSADGTADGTGVWDLTGVGLSQLIPAQQLTGTYSIEMTLTIS